MNPPEVNVTLVSDLLGKSTPGQTWKEPHGLHALLHHEIAPGCFVYDKLERGTTHYALFPPIYRTKQFYPAASTPIPFLGTLISTPFGVIEPPPDLAWLRISDKMSFNGTLWEIESSWLGAPEWDSDLYGAVG